MDGGVESVTCRDTTRGEKAVECLTNLTGRFLERGKEGRGENGGGEKEKERERKEKKLHVLSY